MSRIVIVDDHPLVCMAVRILLEKVGHSVVAEVDNGVEAIAVIRKLLPDLVILDLAIPKLDGLSVIAHLRAIGNSTRILILTSADAHNYALRSLQVGAAGFLSKDYNLDEIVAAAKAVLSGYSYFPEHTIHQLRDNTKVASNEGLLIDQLSDREISVLKLLARGLSNQAIANELLINHKTVSTYKIRLLRKLGVENLIALGDLAKRNGLA